MSRFLHLHWMMNEGRRRGVYVDDDMHLHEMWLDGCAAVPVRMYVFLAKDWIGGAEACALPSPEWMDRRKIRKYR